MWKMQETIIFEKETHKTPRAVACVECKKRWSHKTPRMCSMRETVFSQKSKQETPRKLTFAECEKQSYSSNLQNIKRRYMLRIYEKFELQWMCLMRETNYSHKIKHKKPSSRACSKCEKQSFLRKKLAKHHEL